MASCCARGGGMAHAAVSRAPWQRAACLTSAESACPRILKNCSSRKPDLDMLQSTRQVVRRVVSISDAQKAAALVGQMVGFLEQLQGLRWEETGSFYPSGGAEGAEGREAVRLGETTTCNLICLGSVSPRWRCVFQGRTSTASTGPSAARRTLRTGC